MKVKAKPHQKEFVRTIISALVLTSSFLVVIGETIASAGSDDFHEVVLRREDQCNKVIEINSTTHGYTVIVDLERDTCPTTREGFSCQQAFYVPDAFDLLGYQVCVDIQGVDDAVRSECQLSVDVISSQLETLKGVYCITRLKPKDSPYYICTDGNSLSLSLNTLESKLVCPSIMEYLYTRKVLLGSVSMRPYKNWPVYVADLHSCDDNQATLTDSNSFTVKMFAPSLTPRPEPCRLRYRWKIVLDFPKMTGCLTVLYTSPDYFCRIEVNLMNSIRGHSKIELSLGEGFGSSHSRNYAPICKEFDVQEGDPILEIGTSSQYKCSGQWAFQVAFRPVRGDDSDEDSPRINSPRVFIAVFIALIVICLICLGVTCLCCIRFRTKRRRNAGTRRHHGGPPHNLAFDGSTDPNPPYEGSGPSSISWSQSEPGAIFGLPSYEDIAGERPGGANPASGTNNKEDFPPSYDSIFTSET